MTGDPLYPDTMTKAVLIEEVSAETAAPLAFHWNTSSSVICVVQFVNTCGNPALRAASLPST